MKKLFVTLLALCVLLCGCVSPREVMKYRDGDCGFEIEATVGGAVYRCAVTLENGGTAKLVFTAPEDVSGVSVYGESGVTYIGQSAPVPVKDGNSGCFARLLAVLSACPTDVKTTVRTELDGCSVYRCETDAGAVFVSESAGTPVFFIFDGGTARVVG